MKMKEDMAMVQEEDIRMVEKMLNNYQETSILVRALHELNLSSDKITLPLWVPPS